MQVIIRTPVKFENVHYAAGQQEVEDTLALRMIVAGVAVKAIPDDQISALYGSVDSGGVFEGIINPKTGVLITLSGGGGDPFKVSYKTIDYFVSEDGNDTTGTGSDTAEYATLTKAITEANAATGDKVIYIKAGLNYTITSAIGAIRTGVSIMGAGRDLVTVRVTYTTGNQTQAGLYFGGNAEGVYGNQFLTGITLDGGTVPGVPVCSFGCYVRGRSNVSIYNCRFRNFAVWGVTFSGQATEIDGFGPAVLATGNTFYDNLVDNCSQYAETGGSSVGYGGLQFGGQDGFKYWNNTINQTTRPSGQNGYCVKQYREGFSRNIEESYNTFNRNNTGTTFPFCVEHWNIAGYHAFGNTYTGAVDVICSKGDTQGIGRAGANTKSTYGMWAHSNTFVQTTQGLDGVGDSIGFNLEDKIGFNVSSDIIIEGNRSTGIRHLVRVFSTANVSNLHNWKNVKVVNNLVIGGSVVGNHGISQYDTFTDWEIDHNTGDGTGAPVNKSVDGIQLTGVWVRPKVRRNILLEYQRHPIATGQVVNSTITDYTEDGNIIFDCGSEDTANVRAHITASGAVAPSGVIGTNRYLPVTKDNLFNNHGAGDYTLKTGSPAVSIGTRLPSMLVDYVDALRGVRATQLGQDDVGCYAWNGTAFNQPIFTVNRTDTFNRADGAIGTPSDAGAAWQVLSGTWNIVSNEATSSSFSGRAVLNSGSANVLAKVTQRGTGGIGIVFRAVDANNYMYAQVGTTQIRIRSVVAGVDTVLKQVGFVPAINDVFDLIVTSANLISMRVNGIQRITHTSSQFSTATLHGLWATNSGGTFIYDDFTISNIT